MSVLPCKALLTLDVRQCCGKSARGLLQGPLCCLIYAHELSHAVTILLVFGVTGQHRSCRRFYWWQIKCTATSICLNLITTVSGAG